MKKYLYRSLLIVVSFTLQACSSLPNKTSNANLISACSALINYYPIPRDAHDAQAYGAMFTENGEFILQGDIKKGRANIEKALLNRQSDGTIRHLVGSVNVTPVNANVATGYSYAMVIKSDTPFNGKPLPLTQQNIFAVVTYEDTFSYTNKQCKFSQRKAHINFLNNSENAK